MKDNYIHSGIIEVAVANLLNYRVYTIVPNVSYGLYLNHECDMLALDKNDRFTEIEIKISASDLKADFSKRHGHKSKYISRLIYAMPMWMCEKYEHLIPKHCGIISVSKVELVSSYITEHHQYEAHHWRMVKHDKSKAKPDDKIIRKFMELGCMRIWSLKQTNNLKRMRSKKLKTVPT